MPADASLFGGIWRTPFLPLIPYSLSQREPLIQTRPSILNYKVSCALVTGGVTGFVFSGDVVSKRGSAVCATGYTVDSIDTYRGT